MEFKFSISRSKKNTVTTKSPIKTDSFTSVNYTGGGVASWISLKDNAELLKCYNSNPVLKTIIGIDADAWANAKLYVKTLSDGEEIPLEEYTKDGGYLKDLIGSPNPLQSTSEWIRQTRIMRLVFGNSYNYASVPSGFKFNDYRDISVINNMHAYCVEPILTGKWLEATEIEEIIERYEFRNLSGNPKKIPTRQVFHDKNNNLRLDANFTKGVSDLVALRDPITNIALAYESRNVLIKKRGASGILTPEAKDEAIGAVSLNEEEIEETQEAYKKYGGLEDQHNLMILPQPLKYQKMVMNVKELMLFEEIEADAIAIANALGVPELLAKYYIKGGTFENLNASERRLYDSSVIPKFNAWMQSLNVFLNTESLGIQLIGKFDHLNVLQKDKKLEADTLKIKTDAADKAFRSGAIDYDTYLAIIDQPNNPTIGSKKITELTTEELNAIGVSSGSTNTQEDEPSDD